MSTRTEYVLVTEDVPRQGQYYAGPTGKVTGRMAHRVACSLERATIFATEEAADAMRNQLGGGYRVVRIPH